MSDGAAAMNGYYAVAIFTDDWTTGPVGISLPDLNESQPAAT